MNKATFGTDGIRGIYGDTLTEETAYRLGAALGKKGSILLGRDNRPSSPSLARALACGARAAGGDVRAVGITTTPALYYLLSVSKEKNAVMVTASHNPPEHNGLKVFTKNGKPSEKERRELEGEMGRVTYRPPKTFRYKESGDLRPYIEYVKTTFGSLKGVKVVLDCAKGAGSVFKGLYREMGAEEITINARKNGAHINVNSGALHPEICAREVVRRGADLGVALDGDGDRITVVTRSGKVLDGDRVTYFLACRMKEQDLLPNSRVAMTVMTNGGILKSLAERGISVTTTAVGDSALAQRMKEDAISLGGEQSGHVILADYLPTGDGIAVGAALLKCIAEGRDPDAFPAPLLYPQVLINVAVKDTSIAYTGEIERIAAAIKQDLQEGRILLRASGTENVVRIMAEHPDPEKARRAAERLREELLRRL